MPRAKWRQMLEASKHEALLAVEQYNRPAQPRALEAFFVHMHLAWLYLLHAEFRREGVDYHYRQPNGWFVRIDGEPKAWDLKTCVDERWPFANHPVRKNLEFTIGLRNKIEHRYEEAFRMAVGGYAQAMILNYEQELVDKFGKKESIAGQLRFPLFLGGFTEEGADLLRKAQKDLPRRARSFLADFRSGLEPSVANDNRFEFRLQLVPMVGPKSEADMALRFVRLDDLDEEQRELLATIEKGTVIVRERQRDVVNLGKLRPAQAAALIQEMIPFEFNTSHFIRAWKKLRVRPPTGAEHPERTDERYCIYDEPHKDYVYTKAFCKKLAREAKTREGFKALTGSEPRTKVSELRLAEGKSA